MHTLYTETSQVGQLNSVVRSVRGIDGSVAACGGRHAEVRPGAGRREASAGRRWLLAVDGHRRSPFHRSGVLVDVRASRRLTATARDAVMCRAACVHFLDVERSGQRQFTGREASVTTRRSATATKQTPETTLKLLLRRQDNNPSRIRSTQNKIKCFFNNKTIIRP